jgi:hypothetical protein
MTRDDLTPEFMRSVIRYDGSDFWWLERPEAHRTLFSPPLYSLERWNRNFAGTKVKLHHHRNGYSTIRVHSLTVMTHRAIWVLHYGAWPKGEVDHINGNRADNRIENLRDVSKAGNMRNQYARRNSISGFPGVHFRKGKKRKPWVARIGKRGTWITLGYFATREEAIACRKREQVKYGFTERHGESRPQVAA